MRREQEITIAATGFADVTVSELFENHGCLAFGFEKGARWADSHPSDETIMRVLNCIGYEDTKWIDFVRKRLETINGNKL